MSERNDWVSAENVIRAWQSSASIREAAQKCGMREDALRQRAYMLRKKGIPLKPMGNPTRKLDVKALSELAESLAAPPDTKATTQGEGLCPSCRKPLPCPDGCDWGGRGEGVLP